MTEKTHLIINCICALICVSCFVGIQAIRHHNPDYPSYIYKNNMNLQFERSKAELVDVIDKTIRGVAPNTSMNGLEILNQCELNDIDLFFVLAQGQLESHYGTKGMAQRTNSVFNVFAYDGKKYSEINKNGKYSHPDLSIRPYMNLLRKKYLVDGKTEFDLMANYVDVNGHRYASNEKYEQDLRRIYDSLRTNKPLSNAYDEYMKYKIISSR